MLEYWKETSETRHKKLKPCENAFPFNTLLVKTRHLRSCFPLKGMNMFGSSINAYKRPVQFSYNGILRLSEHFLKLGEIFQRWVNKHHDAEWWWVWIQILLHHYIVLEFEQNFNHRLTDPHTPQI